MECHYLPHFKAIYQVPLPQLPSVIQIGFAWLPRLSDRQRQSLHPAGSGKASIRRSMLQDKCRVRWLSANNK
jgi:hypothetical protein